MTTPTAPRTDFAYAGLTSPGWSAWIAPEEEVAALRWPGSVNVYHKMRTDGQVSALLKGTTWPLRRRGWRINPNGASDEAVEMIATDLGLPIKGEADQPVRGRKRFSHDDHLRHALLALVYGHMFMEQQGIIGPDLSWRLRKLLPLMPHSISKIDVARDGGLVSVTQHGSVLDTKPIPVSQLVAYTWEREGGNWTGRSLLRTLYRSWLVKDRLIRIDALKNERYGLGIPTGTAPPGAKDTAVYGELASKIRAGETSGVGLPNGASLAVQGVTGSLPDTVASIRMHDEAMARDFLMMFLQLGTTETGSRALGGTFVDFFDVALDTISDWYTGVTNEHVIEDMIDWNFGSDENAPLIEDGKGDDDDDLPLSTTDLTTLIDKGVLVVDDNLETWVRDRHGLPERGENPRPSVTVVPPVTDAPPAVAARTRPVAAASSTATTGTVGHRAPSVVEAEAGVDFETLQRQWQTDTEAAVSEWAPVREAQIDALTAQVLAAVNEGNLAALATVSAPVLGVEIIEAAMMRSAETGVATATAEGVVQGVVVGYGDVELLRPTIRARAQATATLMARALSDSAARNAIMRYGADLAGDVVAAAVRQHLTDLSTAYLTDTIGGALTQAQNTGRRVVMSTEPSARIYASELMDNNTCTACANTDGRQYDTMAAAEADYPTGGNAECAGGPRCRGTLVAVYSEATATT